MSKWRSWFFDPRLLLVGGVMAGIGLGLFVGWWAWPVSYYNTDLFDLHPDYQDEYVVMVGALVALEQDATTARQLLGALADPTVPRSVEAIVVDVTERYIAQGADQTHILYLVRLADALDTVTLPMQPYLR